MNSPDPQTLCNKCNNYVRTANYLIHEARCKGPSASNYREPSSQRSRSSRIFSSRMSNPMREEFEPIEEEERIPCPFCGYGQTLAELDTHPNRCLHRETTCQECNGKYPLSLIEQHYQACPAIIERRRRMESRPNPNLPMMLLNMFEGERRGMRPEMNMERQMDMIGQFQTLIQLLAGRHQHGGQRGLTPQQIQGFKTTRFRVSQHPRGEQAQKCIICYCEFEEGDSCMQLKCKHTFHPECVTKWLQKNPLCPVCKQDSLGRQAESNEEREEHPMQRHIHFRFI